MRCGQANDQANKKIADMMLWRQNPNPEVEPPIQDDVLPPPFLVKCKGPRQIPAHRQFVGTPMLEKGPVDIELESRLLMGGLQAPPPHLIPKHVDMLSRRLEVLQPVMQDWRQGWIESMKTNEPSPQFVRIQKHAKPLTGI